MAIRKPERGGQVQVLSRALAILNRLAAAESGLSLTEIAKAASLAPSTAHRILTSLQAERFVRCDPETRNWTVGVQAFMAGSAFLKTRNVAQMARAPMRSLMERSGETVNLALEDQGSAVYVAQIECREMMRSFARLGARVPMHCSGVGKALLAAMDETAFAQFAHKRSLAPATARSLKTLAALRADIERTKLRGYALDDEEHAVGLRCVAAAIYDEQGRAVSAVSLSGPKARIADARLAKLGDMVAATAARITAEIGGRAPG
jgi:IclR family transcriptional regulator, acetate operon repressor